MKKTFLFILVAVFSFGFFSTVEAQSASLYLSPSSGSFLVGSTFTVSIYVNTEDNEVNVIWAELGFPPDILQVTSPTAGMSLITEWLTPPNYSNERGVINFQGGVPGGISASAGLISSVTFRAISSGVAEIKFKDNSKVLLNDGKGTDILTTKINGEYYILVPPPDGPEVFSPTHPNPNVWYSDSSPTFSWEKEQEVTDFSWVLDQNPNGRPDGISEGIESIKSFIDIPDGVWFFHIRQREEEIWGKTSHIQVTPYCLNPYR